jgi:hypothetical protein
MYNTTTPNNGAEDLHGWDMGWRDDSGMLDTTKGDTWEMKQVQ